MTKIQKCYQGFLLPTGFRKVGVMLLIMNIIVMALQFTELWVMERQLFKAIITSGLLSSFLIIAQTKQKIEDERSVHIRLMAWFFAVISISVMVIISPFLHLLFDNSFVLNETVPQILISLFMMYFSANFFFNRFL